MDEDKYLIINQHIDRIDPMTRQQAAELGLFWFIPIQHKCDIHPTAFVYTSNRRCCKCYDQHRGESNVRNKKQFERQLAGMTDKERELALRIEADRHIIDKWARWTAASRRVGSASVLAMNKMHNSGCSGKYTAWLRHPDGAVEVLGPVDSFYAINVLYELKKAEMEQNLLEVNGLP